MRFILVMVLALLSSAPGGCGGSSRSKTHLKNGVEMVKSISPELGNLLDKVSTDVAISSLDKEETPPKEGLTEQIEDTESEDLDLLEDEDSEIMEDTPPFSDSDTEEEDSDVEGLILGGSESIGSTTQRVADLLQDTTPFGIGETLTSTQIAEKEILKNVSSLKTELQKEKRDVAEALRSDGNLTAKVGVAFSTSKSKRDQLKKEISTMKGMVLSFEDLYTSWYKAEKTLKILEDQRRKVRRNIRVIKKEDDRRLYLSIGVGNRAKFISLNTMIRRYKFFIVELKSKLIPQESVSDTSGNEQDLVTKMKSLVSSSFSNFGVSTSDNENIKQSLETWVIRLTSLVKDEKFENSQEESLIKAKVIFEHLTKLLDESEKFISTYVDSKTAVVGEIAGLLGSFLPSFFSGGSKK